MKKKGFTLVELLAVIAILAILVIIALPNVLGMFQSAKKNTFTTELQNIYKSATTQYVSDSMNRGAGKSAGSIAYGRTDGHSCGTSNILDLSGTESIDFFIQFNLSGQVTQYYATDEEFGYYYSGPGLAIEDIVGAKVITIASQEVDNVTYTSKLSGILTDASNFANCSIGGNITPETNTSVKAD